MRNTLTVLACYCILIFTAEAKADEPAESSGVQFTYWPYKTSNGEGCFLKQGKEWLEVADGKIQFRFQETDRTSDYVELYDGSRKMWVRLTPDSAVWSQSGKEWFTLPVKPAKVAGAAQAAGKEALATKLDGAWRLVATKHDGDDRYTAVRDKTVTLLVAKGRFILANFRDDGELKLMVTGSWHVPDKVNNVVRYDYVYPKDLAKGRPFVFKYKLEGKKMYREMTYRAGPWKLIDSAEWERVE